MITAFAMLNDLEDQCDALFWWGFVEATNVPHCFDMCAPTNRVDVFGMYIAGGEL